MHQKQTYQYFVILHLLMNARITYNGVILKEANCFVYIYITTITLGMMHQVRFQKSVRLSELSAL